MILIRVYDEDLMIGSNVFQCLSSRVLYSSKVNEVVIYAENPYFLPFLTCNVYFCTVIDNEEETIFKT